MSHYRRRAQRCTRRVGRGVAARMRGCARVASHLSWGCHGGAGFVGSHIVEELLRRGEKVRVLDNFSTGKRENLEPFIDKIEFMEGDLRSQHQVREAVRGVDYISHQGALPSVPRSVQDPITSDQGANLSGHSRRRTPIQRERRFTVRFKRLGYDGRNAQQSTPIATVRGGEQAIMHPTLRIGHPSAGLGWLNGLAAITRGAHTQREFGHRLRRTGISDLTRIFHFCARIGAEGT